MFTAPWRPRCSAFTRSRTIARAVGIGSCVSTPFEGRIVIAGSPWPETGPVAAADRVGTRRGGGGDREARPGEPQAREREQGEQRARRADDRQCGEQPDL